MNRRLRNRTSGGVGATGGDPRGYPIGVQEESISYGSGSNPGERLDIAPAESLQKGLGRPQTKFAQNLGSKFEFKSPEIRDLRR